MADYMSVDVTRTVNPVAADAGLLANAGSYEGRAAEADGRATGSALEFLGTSIKGGGELYKDYQGKAAGEEAAEVFNSLYAPDAATPWVGENATTGTKKVSDAGVAEFANIAEAQKQGHLSQQDAANRLSVLLKQRVAANPYAAKEIRAAYAAATGAGDWDIQEMQNAMRVDKARQAAAERDRNTNLQVAMKMVENGANVVFGKDGKALYAMTPAQIADSIAAGRGDGYDNMLMFGLEQKKIQHTQVLDAAIKAKTLSAADAVTAHSSVLHTEVDTSTRQVLIEYSGTAFEGASAEEVVGNMASFKRKMAEAYDIPMIAAQQRFMATKPDQYQINEFNKNMQDLMKQREAALQSMTGSQKDYLATLEYYKRDSKMSAEELDIKGRVFDDMIKRNFTPTEINNMKTEDGRKKIYHMYRDQPEHPMVLTTRYYEARRQALTLKTFESEQMANDLGNRLDRVRQISLGLNPNATPEQRAALKAEMEIDPTSSNIVAGIQMAEDLATNALKNPAGQNIDKGMASIMAASINMSDKDDIVSANINVLRSGNAFAAHPAYPQYVKNVNARTNMWLHSDDSRVGYASKIKNALGGVKATTAITIDELGNLSLADGAIAGGMEAIATAQRTIDRANKLLDLSSLTGSDRVVEAKKLLTNIKALESGGVVKGYDGPAPSFGDKLFPNNAQDNRRKGGTMNELGAKRKSGADGKSVASTTDPAFPRMDVTPERQEDMTRLKVAEAGPNLQADIDAISSELKRKSLNGTARTILQRHYKDLTGEEWKA